jgi:hypothetical protein
VVDQKRFQRRADRKIVEPVAVEVARRRCPAESVGAFERARHAWGSLAPELASLCRKPCSRPVEDVYGACVRIVREILARNTDRQVVAPVAVEVARGERRRADIRGHRLDDHSAGGGRPGPRGGGERDAHSDRCDPIRAAQSVLPLADVLRA